MMDTPSHAAGQRVSLSSTKFTDLTAATADTQATSASLEPLEVTPRPNPGVDNGLTPQGGLHATRERMKLAGQGLRDPGYPLYHRHHWFHSTAVAYNKASTYSPVRHRGQQWASPEYLVELAEAHAGADGAEGRAALASRRRQRGRSGSRGSTGSSAGWQVGTNIGRGAGGWPRPSSAPSTRPIYMFNDDKLGFGVRDDSAGFGARKPRAYVKEWAHFPGLCKCKECESLRDLYPGLDPSRSRALKARRRDSGTFSVVF